MPEITMLQKLEVLADAAEYDASCASSGTAKRNSLLKILLTDHCVCDCRYCINRKSSTVRRARFTPQEVADLTLAFYRRNCIEGLFLSSGIVKSSSRTMEQLGELEG